MPRPPRIPMPPMRYALDSTAVEIVAPDRCPAGHRRGREFRPWHWSYEPPWPGSRPGYRWRCMDCDGLLFPPTPELYDDLSWYDEPAQVERRAYWAAQRVAWAQRTTR
ncbi:MAG TPA: hypothetical protein VGD67_12040 [Pseudonocardiaceae bacterium]